MKKIKLKTEARKIHISAIEFLNGHILIGHSNGSYYLNTSDGIFCYSRDEMIEVHGKAFINIEDQI